MSGINTGPPYPPPDLDSGIGDLAIGEGQIGTVRPFNVWDTVISQYANSPALTYLVQEFQNWLDQTQNLDSFYDHIWNIQTADNYGLDVWGRIVGVVRTLQVTVGSYFGFKEATPGSLPFNQGPFYIGQQLTQNYNLSDTQFRRVILAKAAFNITNGSIPAINQIMLNLFPLRGNCYVTEGNKPGSYFGFQEAQANPFNTYPFYNGEKTPSMTMTYTFTFPLTPVEIAIVNQSHVLPKPTGVLATTILSQ